jgi:hypothetical protein
MTMEATMRHSRFPALLLLYVTSVPIAVPAQEATSSPPAPAATTQTPAAPAPATVVSWAAAYAHPAIEGEGVDAGGRKLAYGHLELALTSGRLYPVVVAGRVTGAYFLGAAKLRYTSTDPQEAATYRTNVKRATAYEVGAGGALECPVEDALVMLSTGAEDLAGGKPWRDGLPPPAAQAALLEHCERFAGDRATRYWHLLPQAILDPPAQPVVIAEITTDDGDLLLTLDPMRSGEERLDALNRRKTDITFIRDRRFADLLSLQPIGRGRLDPRPRRFLLTAIDAAVANPRGMSAEIEVTETFRALAPVRVLDLALWSSRLGIGGARGLIYENPYLLHSVRLAAGGDLAFVHSGDELLVELPRRLAAGESVSLVFKTSGEVLYRPGNDSYWELSVGGWLPLGARGDLISATYHAVVKVPKPFVPFSCGRTVRRWEEGGTACAEFSEERPIQAPVVLAGQYTTLTDERDGVVVSVSSYAIDKPKAAAKIMEIAFALLQFYRGYVGDYPFKELNIIEINSYGFGEAPAGIIYITKEAFNPLIDEESRIFSEGINARLAHELAHAWWGHVAMLGAPEDQWLSESVSQLYAGTAIEKLRGKRWLNASIGDWKTWASTVKDNGSVCGANYLSGERGAEDRLGLLYGKGPLVLQALRTELGDQVMFTILKSYLKSFPFQPASTKQFIALTNYVTKKDYGPWFDRYMLGTEWPKQ